VAARDRSCGEERGATQVDSSALAQAPLVGRLLFSRWSPDLGKGGGMSATWSICRREEARPAGEGAQQTSSGGGDDGMQWIEGKKGSWMEAGGGATARTRRKGEHEEGPTCRRGSASRTREGRTTGVTLPLLSF
jgi:hypothetical protein